MIILTSTWTVLKDLMKKSCLLENIFLIQQKKGKIGDDGKISGGHISVKKFLTCEKIWDKFEMKNMGNYHGHYLKKKMYCYQ